MTPDERRIMEMEFDAEWDLLVDLLDAEQRFQLAAIHRMMARIMSGQPIPRRTRDLDDD